MRCYANSVAVLVDTAMSLFHLGGRPLDRSMGVPGGCRVGRIMNHPAGGVAPDFVRVAKAINFLTSQAGQQPSLEQVAAHVHLSPYHFQRLFSRWAGVSPKRFLQAVTVERAKQLIRGSRPLSALADELGLSGGSRLYDHFVQLEALSPGEYRAQGAGLTISHGEAETPFGILRVAATPRGICRLAFADEHPGSAWRAVLAEQLPGAVMQRDDRACRAIAARIFSPDPDPGRPLSLHVFGTNLQIQVWRALLRIPSGQLVSYSQIAEAVGRPRAARAIGTAIAANPVALLIPCHRVIRQNGEFGIYQWGQLRKRALHAWEATR